MTPNITTYTNAPAAYDYGTSADTGIRVPVRYGSRTVTLREVQSPEDLVRYQRDRYLSGFYITMDFMELCESTPAEVA